jgi:hypothetical protein
VTGEAYAKIRRQIGTQLYVGRKLFPGTKRPNQAISDRETGKSPVTREVEYALRWLAMKENR